MRNISQQYGAYFYVYAIQLIESERSKNKSGTTEENKNKKKYEMFPLHIPPTSRHRVCIRIRAIYTQKQ